MMFGQRLKELRKARRGLTQEKMAEQLGVAKTTYASYEQNKRMPDAELQKQVADYFNVSLDYLHGREKGDRRLSTKQMAVVSRIDDKISSYDVGEIIDFIEFIKTRKSSE